jgi:hypothetical protein
VERARVLPVLTVGVDLAAESERTAVAWIDWSPGRAVVQELVLGADDDLLVQAIGGADKAGIGCPLGWPQESVAAGREMREPCLDRRPTRHAPGEGDPAAERAAGPPQEVNAVH